MNTLTIEQAINLVPAIGATSPAAKTSTSYQFISTREILERVQQDGWLITNATSQGRNAHAQHRVTLVHEDNIQDLEKKEGYPRIELFNSHNLTKRLMFAVGYFRLVCSNGLIVASGPSETIRTKHRFSGDRLTEIMNQVTHISKRFPAIGSKIEQFKTRQLDQEEQMSFAKFAIKGRYNYWPSLPKRFSNLDETSEKLLQPRRKEDSGNSAWEIYNRLQENIITGIQGFTRPIKSYADNIRVNQLLWKGADTALHFNKQYLNKALAELLVKDGKKGKISA